MEHSNRERIKCEKCPKIEPFVSMLAHVKVENE